MKLRQIEAFRAVMHTGSMTVAAEELHTSQSNVSRAMALLQQETGLTLFRRVGVRVAPTPEAQALLREVDRVYVGIQSIAEAAERIRRSGVDGLRIAVSSTIAVAWLPRILEVFRGRRDRVPVIVHNGVSATICKWVSSGYCEIGLAGYVALPQEVDSKLVHSQHAVCIVPKGHRLARRRLIAPSDLAGEAFISFASADVARAAIDRVFEPETRNVIIETQEVPTVCAMVSRGLGVSVVNPLILGEMNIANIRAIPFDADIQFKCFVVRPKLRPEQALVDDFLEAVQVVVRERVAQL